MEIRYLDEKLNREELIERISIWKSEGVDLIVIKHFSDIGRNVRDIVRIYQEIRKGEKQMDMYFVDNIQFFSKLSKEMFVGTNVIEECRNKRMMAYATHIMRRK